MHPISDNMQRYFDNVDSNQNRVRANLSEVNQFEFAFNIILLLKWIAHFDFFCENTLNLFSLIYQISTGGSIQHVTQQKQSIFQKGVNCSIPSVSSKNVSLFTNK